jgi:TonB-like protein
MAVCLALVAGQSDLITAQSAATRAANLIITVLDPLGNPAADVPLLIENGPFQIPFVVQGHTDRSGRYRVRVPAGSYSVSAPIDFFPATRLAVPLGKTLERTIRMEVGETIGTFSICLDCPESQSDAPSAAIIEEFRSDRQDPLTELVSGAEPVVGWEFFQPKVPDSLRRLGSSAPVGTVVIEGRIGVDGRAVDLHTASTAHPLLTSAAETTLAETRWRPATVRGKPVQVPVRLTFVYVREQK